MSKIVILGAGESGAGAAVLAKKEGFEVFVSDMSKIKDNYKKLMDDHNIEWEEGHHTEEKILDADEVIKSPGIPKEAPMVQKLMAKGTPIISEIEFAGRYTDAKMICITGSNGKTTTTSLIYHIIKSAGYDVGLAGNIGKSLALQVAETPHKYYVIELSSFQLDNMYEFRANVIDATQQTTQTSATVYSASIDEIEVRLAKLAKDCERYRNLVEKKAATPIQLEQLEVEYAATKKKLESVKRQQAAAYKGVNEVVTRKQNVAAAIERAEAAVEMAKLNLSYCVVVAPCDGKLGRRSIEEGQMVNAGTTITYILPNAQKWVIANYKETQVENLYVGQKVRMTVDAISNKEFEGTVTAISGATGSKYSLVPTDNSAGNFVKIQQRVPVRIDFTNLSKEDNARLAAGMMVIVKAERNKK